MPTLADLPSELLDLIVSYNARTSERDFQMAKPALRFLRTPFEYEEEDFEMCYGDQAGFEAYIDRIKLPVRLSQVNRSLRRHFLQRLWWRLRFDKVGEIVILEDFLKRFTAAECQVYMSLVESVWFAWAVGGASSDFDDEGSINASQEEPDPRFGFERDWRFIDRMEKDLEYAMPQLRINYPDSSDEELREMMKEYYEQGGLSAGPDGEGLIPGFESISDVQNGMQRILSQLPNIRDLFWSAWLTPIPASYAPYLDRVESIQVANAWDLGHLDLCMASVRHLTLMYEMDPDQAYEGVPKYDVDKLDLLEYDADSPCGVRLKGQRPECSGQRRVYEASAALIAGLHHRLTDLTLYDVSLLRIKMLLPVWLTLEFRRDWDMGLEWPPFPWHDVDDEYPDQTRPYAVEELRSALEGCCEDGEAVRRACESFKGGQEANEMASWLASSPELSHGASKALQRRNRLKAAPAKHRDSPQAKRAKVA